MIIDNHVHVFPSQAGPAGYDDPKAYQRLLQEQIPRQWGRMISSHVDRKYIPEPGEDVGFTVGKYGRHHWRKHGQDCWVQRGPVVLAEPEHTPEQMLAHMDFVGIDAGVIQAGYLEPNYGREVFFADCIKRWPDRFIGTVDIEYDLSKDDAYLQGEVRKLTRAVEELGFRGLFSHVPCDQPVDDPRCDPLWKEVIRLGIPAYLNTGLKPRKIPRAEYLEDVWRIENVLKRFPEMNVIDAHIGHHLRPPNDPERVDNPREFFPLLKLGNFFLEVGYVLAFENWAVWGKEFEYPYPRHEQIIKTLYENFGAGVIVWGSDMPWTQRTCTYRQCLDLVRLHTSYMTEEERDLITGGTLARLFKVAG
jgi:predicted TIM-barrel fold metal-dependent hydrolase